MNAFLAEQLHAFNKNASDTYDKNWGSMMEFVHEDPKAELKITKDYNMDVF